MESQRMAEQALATLEKAIELEDRYMPVSAINHIERARTQALVAIALALAETVGEGGWLDWLYPTKASGDDTPF